MAENFKLGGKVPLAPPKNESNSPKKEPKPAAESLPEPPQLPEPEKPIDFTDLEDEPQLIPPPAYEVAPFVMPMSEADKLRRRQLLVKIKKYKIAFPENLTDIDTSEIRDMELGELEILAQDIEFMVSVRQSAGASQQLFLSAMTVAETVGRPVGLKLKGLTNVCAANDNLLQTVQECAIKYGDTYAVGPEVRLGLLLSQLVMAVHQHNKNEELEPESEQVPAAPPIDTSARDKLMEEL